MANLINNKTQLQTLLSTIANKTVNSGVTSLNNKTGAVTTETTDLDVATEVWTFELEDGTTVDKTMVFYSPKTPNLINFSIWIESTNETLTCLAEEGMTWEAWCNSSYNTGGFYIYDGYIESTMYDYEAFRYPFGIDKLREVRPADVIYANYAYDCYEFPPF